MIDTKQTVNGSRMTYSRVIGALFLLGFLCYGIGSGIATSLVGGSNFLSTIGASQTLLVTGAFLSERTIETHVSNILDKLGVNSRVEISSWVARELTPN